MSKCRADDDKGIKETKEDEKGTSKEELEAEHEPRASMQEDAGLRKSVARQRGEQHGASRMAIDKAACMLAMVVKLCSSVGRCQTPAPVGRVSRGKRNFVTPHTSQASLRARVCERSSEIIGHTSQPVVRARTQAPDGKAGWGLEGEREVPGSA
jgi:hypothetical protein